MRIVSIVIFLLSLLVHQILKWRLARYASMQLRSGLTGAEIAAKMLQYYGIRDVTISCTQGHLTDHYNPVNKTVNLSETVFYASNAVSAAVAAHECGHAVQHAKGYAFLKVRSAMVPFLSFTSRYMMWIILIGIFLARTTLLPLEFGIGLFAVTTLFTFITLPVEFDASRRALAWINQQNIVSSQEYVAAKNALWWAAMTYVMAALGSLAELLHLLSILNRRRD
ncbi:MAG: zinc metallopeptidase [Candidatus Amoebophilus sp.]